MCGIRATRVRICDAVEQGAVGAAVYRGGMSTPHDIAHQIITQQQRELQGQRLEAMVAAMTEQALAMKAQAQLAEKSQRSAFWFALLSVVVAGGSLAVAILALTLG